MKGSFHDIFGNREETNLDLPEEIIEILNESLPSNMNYVKGENGNYLIQPKIGEDNMCFKGKLSFDRERDPDIVDRLNLLPSDKWIPYIYRIQKKVPVTNVMIGDDNIVIPLEMTVKDPLKNDSFTINEEFIWVEKFSDPFYLTFISPEGDSLQVAFQQKAYDNFNEVLFESLNVECLKITIYLYNPLIMDSNDESFTSKEKQMVMKYSVTPSKAHSIGEAVTALHIVKGLYNKTTTINGNIIDFFDRRMDSEEYGFDDLVNLWEAVLKLENRLKTTFDPAQLYSLDDPGLFNELCNGLVDNKLVIWKHPFDHFHIDGYEQKTDGKTLEECIGMDSVTYQFLEGPFEVSLFGANFKVYSRSEMNGFIITSIDWDDDRKKGAELYIKDAPGKQWTLSRKYITEDEAYNHYKDSQ